MIELLLQAERTLTMGMVDQAERMYRQAFAADPRNSIAVVGLARVALERGDDVAAWSLARQALEIDGENVAAQRLSGRLEEVYAYRGESLPAMAAARDRAEGTPAPQAPAPDPEPEPEPESAPEPEPEPEPQRSPAPAPEPEPEPEPQRSSETPAGLSPPVARPSTLTPAPAAGPRRGFWSRLLGRFRS